ncbi:hypothetical protein [Streptomyces griseofuscus]|uniref:hypothetical protein n=1 Tax=Streptomyces griseofuscus TaxID=146922 RepID=UPI00371BAE07
MSTMTKIGALRPADRPCAVVVGVLGVVTWVVLAYSMMMSSWSFGAPDQYELAQAARDAADVARTACGILAVGVVLTGLLRLWRTLTLHLVVFGTGTAVLWLEAASRR